MCITLRNIFSPASCPGLTHPVCTHAHDAGEPRTLLAPDTVLAVRSSKARNGMSAGNDVDCEPGTGDGKPGTRDGASGITGYGKPGTGDGEPEPGTRNQGVPGTTDGRARDGTSAGNDMDCEPGTGNSKPGTRDSAVQCMCVHASLLNKFTLVIHRTLGLFHVENILYINISYRLNFIQVSYKNFFRRG